MTCLQCLIITTSPCIAELTVRVQVTILAVLSSFQEGEVYEFIRHKLLRKENEKTKFMEKFVTCPNDPDKLGRLVSNSKKLVKIH